ncbi:Rft-1-domain-containing protein [Neolentinus lepideus HHB14362 ss-1]|uniref:Man(5)GlcNAc(2)-PP-dolichol translocation protein RFT1 n=1 Tax=Neolentinus lepideus HHB14362 ss-1 TaxID=1314782 RepID=A0A165MF61_9AGAM|nr:Rft-1-domain-containing protein [Neolentinus lepideus HHB14362 ss-1]
MPASLSAASLSSVRLLMGLQLSVRLVTFVLNQALLRKTSPRAFGTAAIHFELLLSTILFLSREGVRNTLIRVWPSPKSDSQHAATDANDDSAQVPSTLSNLTYLPMIIGVPLALITSFLYWCQSSNETRGQPYFELSIIMYALAALIELMSEPMHIRAMGELRTNVRVRAEAVGVIGKAATTFIILFIDSHRKGSQAQFSLLAFAGGQFMYASLVLSMYLVEYPAFFPRIKSVSNIRSSIDQDLLRLSLTMTSQSVVKHVLTEGDKLIVSRLSPLDDQGGYAVAVNYGSLVARIVFQPIEETLRLYFSKLLSPSSSSSTPSSSSSTPSSSSSSLKYPTTSSPSPSSLLEASRTLTALLSTQLSLSLLTLTFGPPYLPLLLSLLLPSQYLSTSAPRVLQAWLWYLPVLAINGGMEAFVSSVAGPGELNRQSRWMTAFSILYILSALSLYSFGLGDTSLVYANIVNLLSRILYCLSFTQSYFASHSLQSSPNPLQWRHMIPDSRLTAVLGLASAVIRWNAKRIGVNEVLHGYGKRAIIRRDMLSHVAIGVSLGVVSLCIWWFQTGRELVRSRRVKTD